MRRRLYYAGITFAAIAVVAVISWRRASRTVEYQVYFGAEKARLDICRSIPKISARRQARLLRRLLGDPSAEVRGSAITAAARSRVFLEMAPMLEQLLADSGQPAFIRQKAGLALWDNPATTPAVRAFLQTNGTRPETVAAMPRLLALYLVDGARDDAAAMTALLGRALSSNDPLQDELRNLLRRRAGLPAACRTRLVDELAGLDAAGDYQARRFVLQCLQQIDGAMRGVSADDWQTKQTAAGTAVPGHVIEAEWAVDIEPNYQIDEFQGQRCLALGEGAGGIMHWLKAEDGTVDVGAARLSCHIRDAGTYQVWARVYLDDKCGNSFGFYLDDTKFVGFSDAKDVLDRWHWLRLRPEGAETPTVELSQGFHAIDIDAWEDSVFIDRFAVLKPGSDPAALKENAARIRWDPRLLSSLSFTLEHQSQVRGSRQKVTVWVRRSSPQWQAGEVTLKAPAPFRVTSPNPTHLRFSPGSPLARTSFEVELPAEATAGEVLLQAVYTEGERTVEGQIVLGAMFDWQTTGPLDPYAEPCLTLLNRTSVDAKDLLTGWEPYPATGIDRYRRLVPEQAWGPIQDKYLYFCTDIEVTEAGDYLALLTSDDNACVWVDGARLIEQPKNGPAEGRMVTAEVRLEPGRHRLFARLYQRDFKDPDGANAGRHSFNNCAFKLLLRQSRHVPAASIRGLPWKRRR